MARKSYPSDLSEEKWNFIKQFIPEEKSGGRPRDTDIREVINAIFYLNKEGCSWRGIPGDFPPWQTVYTYFKQWRESGTWKKNQRQIEDFFEKTRGKRKPPVSGYFRLPEREDFFTRGNKGFRWWEKDQWPQTPHTC